MSLLNRYADQNPYGMPVDPATRAMQTGQYQDDPNAMAISREHMYAHPEQPAFNHEMPQHPRGNLGKIIAGGLSAMGGQMGGPMMPQMPQRPMAPPPAAPLAGPLGAPPGPPPGMQFGPPPGAPPGPPAAPPTNPLDAAYARSAADVGPRAAITPTPGGLPPLAPPTATDPMLMRQQARMPYPLY